MNTQIKLILKRYCSDRTRLLDILWDLQGLYGYFPEAVVTQLSESLNMSANDIYGVISFYHFFHDRPTGRYKIYLSDTVIARMNGYEEVRTALEQEANCHFGGTDETGTFSLFYTNCIGLSDQEPAMLIDDVVFTQLSPGKVRVILSQLRQNKTPAEIVNPEGLPSSELAYVERLVKSNIRHKGAVFFKKINHRVLLDKCLNQLPEHIVENMIASHIRGRGGAGFPTGLKWQLCRDVEAEDKVVICNADEGEPGTFKDRVLLTHSPRDVFVGMIIAGHAIGSNYGLLYLRAEYRYLKDYLEYQLQQLRTEGLLGIDFDIRIQMGAGAYVCGDETALIESCEGKRGVPRVKPPFPIQNGYLGRPTNVNNVETFAAVTTIMERGAQWYRSMGTKESSGTRLLSVSGDCAQPGIYEVEWGITLGEILDMVGAQDASAVQVSGPSGECVSVAKDAERELCYDDLSCNGSFMIFDQRQDLLRVVQEFMRFFVDESCGICVPCRVGNVELLRKVDRLIDGKGCQKDLDDLVSWGKLLRATSRCGLGTTSAKPILTTLDTFPGIYQNILTRKQGTLLASFDLKEALPDGGRFREE